MRRVVTVFCFLSFAAGAFFLHLPSSCAEEEFMLEEITVTAQKREENQQKVAIAMDVISAEDIQTSGKNNLEEILGSVPSMTFAKASDGLRISLRGVSDDTTAYHGQSGSTPTVAVNMDGVYSNLKNNGYGLYDMERVEVLYGPQSTMYASNSPGGIVNVVTASPKIGTYEGSGTIEYGNYDTLHTEGMVNVPVSDTVALRGAFSTSHHDGYLSNGGNSEDAKSARLRALYAPKETLSFQLTGEVTKSNAYMFGGVDAFIDESDVDDPWETDRVIGAPTESTNKKIYGRMDWELPFATLSLVPSYSKTDSYGESTTQMDNSETYYYENDNESEERNVELRLSSSPDSFLTWIVGVYYYKSEQTLDQVTRNEDGTYDGEMKFATMDEEAKAIFANVTYPITDTFRATAGVRQSWDDIYVFRNETMYVSYGTSAGTLEYNPVEYDHQYSDPDYKIGVQYDLLEDMMLYADFSTSYRAQGLEGAGAAGPGTSASTPPPEKLKAYSAGVKSRFFNNKLQVNASAFYYDYENYSVAETIMAYYGTDTENPMSDYVTTEPNSSTWGNGNMMGLDLQTTTVLSAKDILNFSVSYLKTEWTDLYFDYYYEWECTSDAMRGESKSVSIIPLVDKSYNGKPMTISPEWTISASYKHVFTFANGANLEPEISAVYKSDYDLTWNDADSPYNYQEAFTKINLNATYTEPGGKWTLSAYVRNLTDYAEKQGYLSSGVTETRVGDPRTYGAVFSVRF